MTTAADMLARMESLHLLFAMEVSVAVTDDDIIAAQKWQLSQGLKADDNYMPDYSPRSVIEFGKPAGPIKLFDQGTFYRGIKVDVRGAIFFIYSTDWKNAMLVKRYGENIFGLGTEATNKYLLALEPEIVKIVSDELL